MILNNTIFRIAKVFVKGVFHWLNVLNAMSIVISIQADAIVIPAMH